MVALEENHHVLVVAAVDLAELADRLEALVELELQILLQDVQLYMLVVEEVLQMEVHHQMVEEAQLKVHLMQQLILVVDLVQILVMEQQEMVDLVS
jgi:hypothetical protein